jgi:FkbM family methyltransferase
MKKNYNNLEIELGSLIDLNPKILQNIEGHLNLTTTDNDDTSWHNRFNCEYKELKNFIKLTQDKNTLLDIGCQFGSFSLTFLSDSKTKQVYAFDGGDTPYLALTQIKMLNKLHNLHVFNFLIGNQNKKIECYQEELQSLAIKGNDVKNMFSIDMLCNLYNIEPDVIKIDIEGAEFLALSGAQQTIIENKPIIFIEIHPKFLNHYNNTIDDIISFVDSINYKIIDLNQQEVTDYKNTLQQETTDSNRTVWIPK